jgi:hypothetical protein
MTTGTKEIVPGDLTCLEELHIYGVVYCSVFSSTVIF